MRMSRNADKHVLYQKAVQEPVADVHFLRRAYKQTFDRKPTILREDFCGTAASARSGYGKRKIRSPMALI